MKKIKILQIIPSFGIGGAEKLVLDYLTYLDKEALDVRAISLYKDENTHYNIAIKDQNLLVYYLDKKPGLDFTMIRKIKKIIDEFNPDVIHSHLYCMKYLIPSLLNKKNVKMFHTIHNEPQKDARGANKLANKLAFKICGVTPIALTDDLREEVNKYYRLNNAITVHNGICLDNFKKVRIDTYNAKKRLEIPPESFVVGHVGRFFKQKNHTLILDIFADVLKKRDDSYLLLVGDGELKSEIQNKATKLGISSNVKFLGIRDDMPEIITAMDVFLFPSLHEGFPITLIEAQATGVKCVISSVIDKNSILSENTLSVNLEDAVEHWSEVILNPSLKNNDFRNIDDYDISKITKKLIDVYGIIENR